MPKLSLHLTDDELTVLTAAARSTGRSVDDFLVTTAMDVARGRDARLTVNNTPPTR